MKSFLPFIVMCFFCSSISAQTNIFTSTNMQDWSSVAFWSLGVVPNSTQDVIISAGSSININQNIAVKSITVQNNAIVKLDGGFGMSIINPSVFQTGSTFNWLYGTIKGGSSLTLNGTANLSSYSHKFLTENTTLINNGVLNITDEGNLYLSNGNLNNLSNGMIHLQSPNGSAIARGTTIDPNILTNTGTIRRSGTGTAEIDVQINNNGGTFLIESGVLAMKSQIKYFNGGIYNVASGAQLYWNTEIVCEGTMTGVLNGDILCSTSSTKILPAKTATFNFTGTNGVNWNYLDVKGGGTLINKSKITLTSSANKFIIENTTLRNEGLINIEGTGTFYLTNGTLNNIGTLDLKIASGDIQGTQGTHVFNNTGLIKRTSEGVVNIGAELHNNSGTIDVQQGTLQFTNLSKYLTNGIYNVGTNAQFNWNTEVVCEGTLTGVLDSEILCSTSSTKIPTNTTATFNFTGTTGVIWNYLDIKGGGTLINKSKITLTSSANKFIRENTTINNEGIMNFEGTGTLYIADGMLNNQATGLIDLKTAGGNIGYNETGSHNLNNFGLLKATSSGNITITAATFNSGTINVMSGELEFFGTLGFTNNNIGIIKGVSTLDLPTATYFTNNGTFAPGDSPGTLTVQGDFNSTTSAALEIELNGTNQGMNYDLLAIQGNAIFNGNINVILGFAPSIATEFIVATTTGTITQCNLPATVATIYNGHNYTFNVICRNNNQIVLTLVNVVLGVEENTLSNISAYPNPSNGQFTINLGKEYETVTIEIYNALGQIITTSQLQSTDKIAQQITSEAGIYFVKVSSDSNVSKTIRILKR